MSRLYDVAGQIFAQMIVFNWKDDIVSSDEEIAKAALEHAREFERVAAEHEKAAKKST